MMVYLYCEGCGHIIYEDILIKPMTAKDIIEEGE